MAATPAPPTTPVFSPADIEWMIIAALALLFVLVGRRVRERGMVTLALAFSLAALWYWRSDTLVYPSPDIDTADVRVWSIVIGAAVVAATAGVVRYLGYPAGWFRWVVVACSTPAVLLIAWLAFGQTISHTAFHDGVLLAYLGPAFLALKRGHDHPGEAHWVLAASLLALVALPRTMKALGVHPLELQHPAGVGLAMFGMILLVVILLRGQRQLAAEVVLRSGAEARLQEANAQLEARVAERTNHLNELVVGLEAFSRGVSHDLRGPLSGMAQLARLAADELDDGSPDLAREALPAISTQCEASTRMVSAMLDLARLGEVSADVQRVDLDEIVRSAFDEVLMGADGDRVPELRVADLSPVCGDPGLLRTAMVNLLGNAVKFTTGCPDSFVQVSTRPHPLGVVVSVRDNGVGFSADDAAQLFEPYVRAHADDYGGHGLGLSIVRRAVLAMGGEVWAEAPTVGGAEICMRLSIPQDPVTTDLGEFSAADTAGV